MIDTIGISNETSRNVPLKFCEEVTKKTIVALKNGKIVPVGTIFELSVVFVDKKDIQQVNKKYRKINSPTDVLSFCYENKRDIIIGELLLCWSMIAQYACENKQNLKNELKRNVIHGLLHIIGYKHGTEMFSLQKKILNQK